MIAPSIPLWGRLGLLLLCGVSGATATYAALCSARLQRWTTQRIENLDAPLRRMLLPSYGSVILSAQISACLLAAGAALGLHLLPLLLVSVIVWPLPAAVIRFMQRRRCRRIEEKLDGFALALANATRATPSIGRALHLLRPTLTAPLDSEVEQALREMKVGSSAEQALLTMSWRVQSPVLDALLSNVLISRRVGGELPLVLETTASTLREMARLEGVLRTKTAQSRTQMWVMCCLPLMLVMAFDAVKPGYFDPLTRSPMGIMLLVMGTGLWVAAILLARKILAVEL